jgi:hypothetical protein
LGGLGGNKMLTRPHGFQSQTVWAFGPIERPAQLSSGEHDLT